MSIVLLLPLLSCQTASNAGDGPAHVYRLTHRQWEETVQDLLGLPAPTGLSEDFVPDASGSTFDTDAAALAVTPVLWQQYQSAAESLAERVVTESELWDVVAPPSLRPAGDHPTHAERDAWLESFARRAYRRAPESDELTRLRRLFHRGENEFADDGDFAGGVRATVAGALQSPGFLYRSEGVYSPDGVLEGDELAAKLSYALWSSMPDATLQGAAADPDGLGADRLRTEATRLLDDPKGHATVADLHRQLLHVDSYQQIWRPDELVLGVGTYDLSVPAAMQAEVYAFVDDIVYSGGGVRDLLTSNRTFANEALADIYGVAGVEGDELVPVDLDPTERAGLLTLSGFLAWEASSSEPNLIVRGAFINDSLLCTDLPPPPADATPLPEDTEGLTMRERIEEHTAGCGGACHNDLLNPIGFAMGLYDQDGRYQTLDQDQPIDATGSFAFTEGTSSFDGAVDLAGIMAESEQVHRCYVGHLEAYLLGIPSTELDPDRLAELTAASLAGAPIHDLILDIVSDDSFRVVRP